MTGGRDTEPDEAVEVEQQPEQTPLQRWSQRKLASRAGSPPAGPDEESADPEARTAGSAQREPGSELTDADMPPLESLTEDSDYSGFLSPKVSEDLRRSAL